MPQNPPLTAPEIAALAAKSQSSFFALAYEPDTLVGTATVDISPQSSPITAIAISGASGGWGNQRDGQLVVIRDSINTAIKGYYRNRAAGTTSFLYIDEVDFADTGFIALLSRTLPITAGDIVTIYERYPIFSVKPIQGSDGAIFQDYAIGVSNNNTQPDEASYNVTINGQPDDQAFMVALGASQALSVNIVVTPWPPSLGATHTYSWTISPNTWTGVSGTLTDTLTGNAVAGSYHVYCLVSDSVNGRAYEINRWIRVYDLADPPLYCNIISDTRGRDKRSIGIRLVQGRVSSMPAAAKCLIFSAGIGAGLTWGGVDVPTAAHTFCGFLYQQPFVHSPAYYESEALLVSPSGVLDMIYAYPATLQYSALPTTWQDLLYSLTSVQFALWWLIRWRTANVLNCFNFTPLNTGSATGHRNLFSIAGNMSILAQLQKLADTYDANVGSRSDGEVIIQPVPALLADRSALIKRGTLDNTIYSNIQVTWVRRNVVGTVTWDGIIAQGTQDVQVRAQWPGVKTSQGGKSVTATDKLFDPSGGGQRVGNEGELANNEYPRIVVDLPTNYDVIEPADMEYWDIAVPASKSPTGSAMTIPSVPVTVTKKWIGGGKAQLQAIFEGLTQGSEGIIQSIPSSQSSAVGQYGNPLTTPPINTPASWGNATSDVPNTTRGLILATLDGHFARGTTWTDGSPTPAQITYVGNVIKLLSDPSQYQRLFMYGDGGLLICDDATVAILAWRDVTISSPGTPTSTLVDTWTVAANNSSVQHGSYSTIAGKSYTMQVSGVVAENNTPPISLLDGYYTSADNWATHSVNPACLMENGALFTPSNLAYQPSHIYTMVRSGTGATFGAKLDDTVYTDNSGTWTINLYEIGTGSSSETPMADMVGSINRQGWFAWLSRRTISGTDYVYVNTTTNYFQSVATSVQIAANSANMTYGLAVSSYNSGATGIGKVTAGTNVYTTSNWFASVSAGPALNARGGAINIPYSLATSASNSSATPQYFYVKGISTNLQGLALDGGTATIISGSTKYPYSNQAVNSFTLNGSAINVVMTTGEMQISNDGGDTFSGATTLPGASGYFVNGSPVNPSILIGGGSASLAISTDRASSWIDLYGSSGYSAFASSTYGSGGKVIVTAMLDLALAYSRAVTQ